MDAAASPLPSDDTTPPVTNMYFTGRFSVVVIVGFKLLASPSQTGARVPNPQGYRRQLNRVGSRRPLWRSHSPIHVTARAIRCARAPSVQAPRHGAGIHVGTRKDRDV